MDRRTRRAITENGKQLGYDKLKPKQIEAVTSFLQGNDVFTSLPTGYGKSKVQTYIICALESTAFRNVRDNFPENVHVSENVPESSRNPECYMLFEYCRIGVL